MPSQAKHSDLPYFIQNSIHFVEIIFFMCLLQIIFLFQYVYKSHYQNFNSIKRMEIIYNLLV